ncbi:MAG: biopolymer transporter Tol [Ignavibacteriae bacterium]|nr:biopolymer transporter Tol [Ignavibacteriota bacterium]MCI0707945.1 biopolymer transporter Tol [Ignavibacteriota bacterium]
MIVLGKRLVGWSVALLLVNALAFAQNDGAAFYGKNKVQYKNFEWQYIQTDHFDIYFAQDGYELASFAADAVEDAYEQIRKLFRYDINSRISWIIYNSHNEFQQTNAVEEYLQEGIGGVTELFKNRVIVPFEGNYKQFRHVIHHELVHAVFNDMYYGGSIQSIISSRTPLVLPGWFNEGMAEYAALKWDTNSDMFLRDATIHNYIPPINFLGGYFAYRGGQSVWYYVANKYGEQKIAEILSRVRTTRSVEQGFKSTIGLTIEELSERWQKEQKVLYWPDIAKREEPKEYAEQLTDHTKLENFYNTSPAISPQGDKIAFLTDRNDFFDIYLMSAIDGEILDKLVSGQRTKDFEELKLLTPRITWSPDGKKIALAVKSGETDAIVIVDVNSGSTESIPFDLDAISSVDWSPQGDKIVFVGSKAPQADIYLYDLGSKELENLTNDIFSDFDPAFSPDGKTVYFSSDRGGYLTASMLPRDFEMIGFDYSQQDLYALDVSSRSVKRLTTSPHGDESMPVASPDGKKLLFVSDRNGINNIYELELETGAARPITNSLSGVYQISLSRDGSKLAFSSLNQAGFDVFLMRAPLERKLNVAELEATEYYKKLLDLPREEKTREVVAETKVTNDTVAVRNGVVVMADTTMEESRYRSGTRVDMRNFVFSERNIRDTSAYANATAARYPRFAITDNRDEEGNYLPRKYKLNFSADLVYGTASYNTFYGLEGTTIMAFSDLMGDHQIVLQTNLQLDLKNSDYGLAYYYRPHRIDYGFQGFHTARFIYLSDPFIGQALHRFRLWGLAAAMSYPIDRFNRLDATLLWQNLSRDNLDNPFQPPQRRSFLLPVLTYVNDNSLWQGEWFGPNNGSRFFLTLYGSTKYSDQSLDFLTTTMDYRDYTSFLRDYVFAYRFTAGMSNGRDRQSFFVGGTEGWIARQFERNNFPIEDVEDYAFLTPVMPLRGYNYNARNGTRYALANFELRFPLVRYFILGALPIGFQNILGTAFVDVGTAFSTTKGWQAFQRDPGGKSLPKDLLIGTGFGSRIFFLGFPLRIDVAWRFNGSSFSEPTYYFSLGPDF